MTITTKQGYTRGPWRTGDVFHTVFGPPNGNPSPKTVATLPTKLTDEDRANARLISATPEMAEALADVSLRCMQARLAHDIGSKTKAQQIDFLLGELQRIAVVADAALTKAGLL